MMQEASNSQDTSDSEELHRLLRKAEEERDHLARLLNSIERIIGDPSHPQWEENVYKMVGKIFRILDDDPTFEAVVDGYEVAATARAEKAEAELKVLRNRLGGVR